VAVLLALNVRDKNSFGVPIASSGRLVSVAVNDVSVVESASVMVAEVAIESGEVCDG
jgi:hypothetical protein